MHYSIHLKSIKSYKVRLNLTAMIADDTDLLTSDLRINVIKRDE